MSDKKFDSKKLLKLNNPQRLKDIPPEYIWNKLQMKEAKVLAEIGSGTAFFSIALAQKFKPQKLYACDISETMIDWMKENVCSKYPNIIPIKTEEYIIPLANEIADIVFTINVHHELEEPDLSLKETYRILKPNGKVFIIDWKNKDMLEGPPKEIRYKPEKVKRKLQNSGFTRINIYNDLPKHFLVIGEKLNNSI